MPHITANGLELFYDENGDRDKETILLVMGLGAQMTLWPDEFVEALVGEGYHVVRYDNRDIGLSEKFDGVKAPGLIKLTLMSKIGLTPKVPYTLADMADDGAGLLDALGIDKAHIVGASMGGMIAQHLVHRHADRCLSLTSVFSTSGNPKLPPARPEAMKALVTRPDSTDEDVLVDHGVMLARTIGSPGYPTAEDRLRARTRASIRRSFYPEGPTRHLSAIVADGDRRPMLRDIAVPTLVSTGDADRFFDVRHAVGLYRAIPDARLRVIPGLDHPIQGVDVATFAADVRDFLLA